MAEKNKENESIIKAIETEYKGYKFRSRLEARWAVFFDTANIPWEYEKEGYELRTGERYLPDFYLPKEEIFVEIKGVMPNKDYLKMLETFAKENKVSVLLLVGINGDGEQWLFGFEELSKEFIKDETDGSTIVRREIQYEWLKVKININILQKIYKEEIIKTICFETKFKKTTLFNIKDYPFTTFCRTTIEDWLDAQLYGFMDLELIKCTNAMKQARFEF